MTLLPWSLALPNAKNAASDRPKVANQTFTACQRLPLRHFRSGDIEGGSKSILPLLVIPAALGRVHAALTW
jgi:hypothetical protein